MNASETNNIVTGAIMVGGPIVARWGVDATTWGSLVNGLVALAPAAGGFLWLVYSHWNMKKVPETAIVIPPAK